MLESAWMLLGAWVIFSYLSGYSYSRKMIFKLFFKYQTHYEVIVNRQKFWFDENYWLINTMIHHGLAIFFTVFIYSVIATIFGLSSTIGWYIAYITLFLAIAYRFRDKSFQSVYQRTCSRIDALLDVSGYSLNISDFQKSDDGNRLKRYKSKPNNVPSTPSTSSVSGVKPKFNDDHQKEMT